MWKLIPAEGVIFVLEADDGSTYAMLRAVSSGRWGTASSLSSVRCPDARSHDNGQAHRTLPGIPVGRDGTIEVNSTLPGKGLPDTSFLKLELTSELQTPLD